jgi:hypothetical protein
MLLTIRWVWHGSTVLDLGPDEPHDIALLKLSRGGADATVIREFNLVTKVCHVCVCVCACVCVCVCVCKESSPCQSKAHSFSSLDILQESACGHEAQPTCFAPVVQRTPHAQY